MENKPELLENDAWLEHTSRASGEDATSRLVRQVIAEAEARDADQENIEHDWQRLRFALKRERQSHYQIKYVAQAAMLLLLAISVYVILPDQPSAPDGRALDMPVMRGIPAQEIYSADIPADAARLAQRLETLGVVVVRNIEPRHAELEVKLSYPLDPKLIELLQAEGIEVPQTGDLKLLYLPKATF